MLLRNQDVLGNAFRHTLDELNEFLVKIQDAVGQVAAGAGQIASASQSFSQGASEQAASLEEISSSTTQIGSQTKTNAENAAKASSVAVEARSAPKWQGPNEHHGFRDE